MSVAPDHAASIAPDWLPEPGDLNALCAKLWPTNARRNSGGEIELGGLWASELASQFGTPLMVIDEDDARSRMRSTLEAFTAAFAEAGTSASIYYAGKAFLTGAVVQWVREEGLNLDVASLGELTLALRAGFPAERIGFHGNNKSVAELSCAIREGVGSIVLDSRHELERLTTLAREMGARPRVRIRVNSGIHASTHSYLATAHEDQKFGVTIADAERMAVQVAEENVLELLGFHSHIGSQIFETSGFLAAADRLLDLHERTSKAIGRGLPELNLGGGFGIAYLEHETPLAPAHMATELARELAAQAAERGIPLPHVAFEPGRSLIGPAGVTLYEVGTIKAVHVGDGDAVRHYVSVDGGMSDNARPALYDADYTVRLASRASTADAMLVRVAGKHCESGDIVVHDDYLPSDLALGDLVAVPATGAYCHSLSSNYNYLTRPAIVAVRHGAAELMVRRETIEDLLMRDMTFSAVPTPHEQEPTA